MGLSVRLQAMTGSRKPAIGPQPGWINVDSDSVELRKALMNQQVIQNFLETDKASEDIAESWLGNTSNLLESYTHYENVGIQRFHRTVSNSYNFTE